MNKAAFLNIVRQVAPIQDQEVEDLEKLVVSFPYCQTAHVLLAKAAYDRGSMLSTQKLRRAAAHVSNRQLLKRLVYSQPPIPEVAVVEVIEEEQITPAPVFEPISEKEAGNAFSPVDVEGAELTAAGTMEAEEPAAQVSSPDVTEAPIPTAHDDKEIAVAYNPDLTPEASILAALETITLEEDTLSAEVATEVEISEQIENQPDAEVNAVEGSSKEMVSAEPEILEVALPTEPDLEDAAFTAVEESEAEEEAEPAVEGIPENELLELIQISSLDSFSAPIPKVNLTHDEIITEITSAAGTLTSDQTISEEPVSFDTILVSDESGKRVSDTTDVENEGQNELESQNQPYAFPMLQPAVAQGTSTTETATPADPFLAIFTQNSLAYWMDSSRLGESIQLKDELTSPAPYYFQPELILEHVRENSTGPALPFQETPAAKLDQQLDIINQFLKSNPRLKTLASVQQKNEPLEDLSAKSSKIKKNLASENLAFIFLKQGKTKKAIKIYEQLIVKFPEKKSYFANQIEKLRNEL